MRINKEAWISVWEASDVCLEDGGVSRPGREARWTCLTGTWSADRRNGHHLYWTATSTITFETRWDDFLIPAFVFTRSQSVYMNFCFRCVCRWGAEWQTEFMMSQGHCPHIKCMLNILSFVLKGTVQPKIKNSVFF